MLFILPVIPSVSAATEPVISSVSAATVSETIEHNETPIQILNKQQMTNTEKRKQRYGESEIDFINRIKNLDNQKINRIALKNKNN